VGKALADADFVQENGPERLDVKRELVAQISAVVPENTIIATSSSGLLVSDIQTAARNPGRTARLSNRWSVYAQGGYQFALNGTDGGRRDGIKGDLGVRYTW
jgi:hypothetical protein